MRTTLRAQKRRTPRAARDARGLRLWRAAGSSALVRVNGKLCAGSSGGKAPSLHPTVLARPRHDVRRASVSLSAPADATRPRPDDGCTRACIPTCMVSRLRCQKAAHSGGVTCPMWRRKLGIQSPIENIFLTTYQCKNKIATLVATTPYEAIISQAKYATRAP